jgi:hypothetical protein
MRTLSTTYFLTPHGFGVFLGAETFPHIGTARSYQRCCKAGVESAVRVRSLSHYNGAMHTLIVSDAWLWICLILGLPDVQMMVRLMVLPLTNPQHLAGGCILACMGYHRMTYKIAK